MDPETRKVLESAVKALADFKRVFGRDLTPALLREMYVALRLDLSPGRRLNEPGFDLVSNEGTRYQVKVRTPSTLNVDVNNFDFDYLLCAPRTGRLWPVQANPAKTAGGQPHLVEVVLSRF